MKTRFWAIKAIVIFLLVVAILAGCEYPFYKYYPSGDQYGVAWVSDDGSMYLQSHDGLLICQILDGGKIVPLKVSVGQGQVWLSSFENFWRVSQSDSAGMEVVEQWSGHFAEDWFTVEVAKGIYHDEGDVITFYRADSEKGSAIDVPPELKEVTVSTSARDADLGHIKEFVLTSWEYFPDGCNHYGIPLWNYELDHRYEDAQLQKRATEIFEKYPFNGRFDSVNMSHYVWELYDYLVESGSQNRMMAPKYVYSFKEDYIVIKFQIPSFDENGVESDPSGDAVYALISAVDGHIIHYGWDR